jgi:hypothetical protein
VPSPSKKAPSNVSTTSFSIGWCEREKNTFFCEQSPNEHAEQRAKTRSISSISFSFYFHVEVVAQIHTWVVAHIYGEVVVN